MTYHPYQRDDRRHRRPYILAITDKPKGTRKFLDKSSDRSKCCEFYKQPGHDTADCIILKKELDE